MLKNFLYLTAFSTFVVIVIVALDVYHKYQVSSLKENTKRRVVSISPNFDDKTLESLKNRVPITVSLEGKSTVVSVDSKSAQLTPTPTISITFSQQSSTGSPVIQQ